MIYHLTFIYVKIANIEGDFTDLYSYSLQDVIVKNSPDSA